jgi:hypothetical protein
MTSRFQQLLEQVELELSQPITNDTVSFIVNEEIALEIPVVEHNDGAIVLAPDDFVYNFLSEESLFEDEQDVNEYLSEVDRRQFLKGLGSAALAGAASPAASKVFINVKDDRELGDGFVLTTIDIYGVTVDAVLDRTTDTYITVNRKPGSNSGIIRNSAPYIFIKNGIAKPAYEVGPKTKRALYLSGLIDKIDEQTLEEAKYQGREVKLGKPMSGDVKKYKVYVKDPQTGNIKKVNFGDKKLSIKRDQPSRRKNFRARHRCATAKDRTSARYWSCRMWSSKPVSKILKGK